MNSKGSEETNQSTEEWFNKVLVLGGSIVIGVVVAIATANSQRNAARTSDPNEERLTGKEELDRHFDNIREEMIRKGLWDK